VRSGFAAGHQSQQHRRVLDIDSPRVDMRLGYAETPLRFPVNQLEPGGTTQTDVPQPARAAPAPTTSGLSFHSRTRRPTNPDPPGTRGTGSPNMCTTAVESLACRPVHALVDCGASLIPAVRVPSQQCTRPTAGCVSDARATLCRLTGVLVIGLCVASLPSTANSTPAKDR
jgi:hypothetical protein